MSGSGPSYLEWLGRHVADLGWYILIGLLGVLGMVGKHLFGKLNNAISREELKEYLEDLEKRNVKRVEDCHEGLKAETDYVKGRVDAIYMFLMKESHFHHRSGDTAERDTKDE